MIGFSSDLFLSCYLMSAHYETVISLSQFEHSTYVFFCQLTFCFKYHTFPLLYVFYYHQTSKCIRIHDIVSKITKGPKVSWGRKVQKSCHVYQKMAWNAFSLKTFASRFHLIRTSLGMYETYLRKLVVIL